MLAVIDTKMHSGIGRRHHAKQTLTDSNQGVDIGHADKPNRNSFAADMKLMMLLVELEHPLMEGLRYPRDDINSLGADR